MMQHDNKWLSEQIAIQCAPLLAGLKPSNLLIIPLGLEEDLILPEVEHTVWQFAPKATYYHAASF